MLYLLLLFSLLFSTTFGHQDGYDELKESTDAIILTPNNTTLLNLEPGIDLSLNFWVKKDPFKLYIDPRNCINETASTSFTFGGGNVTTVKFNLTDQSLKDQILYVDVNGQSVEVELINGKFEIEVNVTGKYLDINDQNELWQQSLGNVVEYPFHHRNDSVEPRIEFSVSNDGGCKVSYELARDEVVLLILDHHHHHHHGHHYHDYNVTITELKESTDTVIITSTSTLINLGFQSYELLDFWVKKDSFKFNINIEDCFGETASTSFIFGFGERKTLKFNLTDESVEDGVLDVNVRRRSVKSILQNETLSIEVDLKQNMMLFGNETFSLGDILTFPIFNDSRVTFFVLNDGGCPISYDMPQEYVVPLKITTTIDSPNEEQPATAVAEEEEDWYNRSLFRKIAFAYLWLTSCAVAFIIGVCIGHRHPNQSDQLVQVSV